MKRFRKIIFWCHLTAGLFAGIVVLIMSVTGVLLTYEKQMIAQADASTYKIVPPAPAARLPIEALVLRARAAKSNSGVPTAVTFRSDQSAAATVALGREGNILVNPYTGETLGEGALNVRGFFRFVTDLHRWLGTGGESRVAGRAITGASNLAFLFLVVSGLYLWFPRKWTRSQFRNVAWFKRGLSGRARDFNWHNTIGFWCLIPLFIIVLSAVTISYAWASNIVYRIVGETPPTQQQPGAQSPARNGANLSVSFDNLDSLLARAEQRSNDWRTISVQLPTAPGAPATFTIDTSGGGQPQKRAQITFNRATGEILRVESYNDLSRGRRLRSWLRFAHTGEFYGLIGQTIAGLASLGGAFLVWTGLSLAWRRFRAWWRGRGRGNTNGGAELIERAPDLESAIK